MAYPQLPRLTSKQFAAAACNGADLSNYLCNDPTFVENGHEGLTRVIASLRAVDASHVIISSEFFFGADSGRLATLRDAFESANLQLRVYLYLREPYEWLVSCYAQYVKSRNLTMDVNEYLLRTLPEMRIAGAVGDLHDVFGANFELALYDRDRLKNHDIRSDFFNRLGVELGPIESPADVNASANAIEIEVLRHFNQLIEHGLWSRRNGRRFLRLAKEGRVEGPPVGRFVRREVEEAVRRRSDEEVAEIKARFFPDHAGPLFKPPAIVDRLSLNDFNESRLLRTITDSMLSAIHLKKRKATAGLDGRSAEAGKAEQP